MSRYLLISLCLLAVLGPLCSGVPIDEKEKDEVAPAEESKDTVTPAEENEQEEADKEKTDDASSSDGDKASTLKADTSGVPKITYSKETKANPGENVNLDCEVRNVDLSGLKDFKIEWSKLSEEGEKTDKMKISSNENIVLLSNKYEVIHEPETYRYSLQMKDVDEKDSGTYRCTIVFGPEQKIDADVPVSVLTPAYFADSTTKVLTVTEGDAISIDCQPGGFPKPEVYWERVNNDLPYYGGKFFKANKFELPLIERSHTGQYRCSADNGLGDPATSEVFLDVDFKPQVKLSSDSVAASAFDTATVSCESEGKPLPDLKWKKGEDDLVPSSNVIIHTEADKANGKTTSKLEFVELQVEDFAEYSCFGDNDIGTNEAKLRIEMKVAPRIEKQTEGEKIFALPEEQRGRDNLPIALECIGSGVPAPEYRWTKDGKIFNWEADPRISLEYGTGTLLIRDPGMQDNGKYQCFAHNEIGVAASDEISLTNSTAIEFIRKEPGDMHYEAEIGRPFRLACPTVAGHPLPTLTWMKSKEVEGGIEMEYVNDERMVIDEKGTLWISYITEEDDTEVNNFKYNCLATSELHPLDISLAKTVTLKTVLPSDGRHNLADDYINIETFLMHSSESEVTFKSNTENKLWCIFGGEPIPQVVWQRADGTELTSDRFLVQNEGHTLVLKDTQLEDAGEYYCLASNGIGENKKFTTKVNVDVVPKFLDDFKNQAQVVQEGTTVTFVCGVVDAVQANPTYEWFFNSKAIEIIPGSKRKVDGSNLVISSATFADVGNYACKASNKAGYAYGQTTLSVIPKAAPDHLRLGTGKGQQVLRNIQKQIETLTSDVQALKDSIQAQVTNNKVQENMVDLLNKIAAKILAAEERESEITTTVEPEA